MRNPLSDILLPYQKLILKEPHNKKVLVTKSRRTGGTWAMALRMVLDLPKSQPWLIVSYKLEASKLVLEDCAYWVNWLCDNGLSKASDWVVLKESITYNPTAKKIRALPCVARVVRGKKGNVFIDEAAHIPNALLGDILDAIRPLQMWGYGITMVSSPFLPGHFTDAKNSGDWSVHSIDIYQAVEQGLYDKICAETGKDKPTELEAAEWIAKLLLDAGKSAGNEYLCEDVLDIAGEWISGNTIFSPVAILNPSLNEAHKYRTKETHTIGVDVGVADNPTCITIMGTEVILGILELRGKKIPEIATFIGSLIGPTTRSVVIDSNGIGRGLADILAVDHGDKIKYCPNTSQFFSTTVLSMLSEIWQGGFSLPQDPIVLEDIKNVRMENGKIIMQEYTLDGVRRHCDTIPSMAMANLYKPKKSMYL